MIIDPNNLLVKYGIDVPGADATVDFEHNTKQDKVTLRFTGVEGDANIKAASEALREKLPHRFKEAVSFGKSEDALTMTMAAGTFEHLSDERLDRGAKLA